MVDAGADFEEAGGDDSVGEDKVGDYEVGSVVGDA